jgi:hypothetical protein
MNTEQRSCARAYANGALDAYNSGTDTNPYDGETEALRHQAYAEGYDYGIFLYCQDNPQ